MIISCKLDQMKILLLLPAIHNTIAIALLFNKYIYNVIAA